MYRLWKRAKLYTGRCSITSLDISASRREPPLVVGLDSKHKLLIKIQDLAPSIGIRLNNQQSTNKKSRWTIPNKLKNL